MNEPWREPSEDLWTELRKTDRPLILYGMGNGADKLISRLGTLGMEISDVFASEEFVRGQSFHGIRVKKLSEIREKYPEFTVLLGFGSSRPEVMENFLRLEREETFRIPDLPVVGTTYFDAEFVRHRAGEFDRAYELLSDELSRELFCAVVNARLTGRTEYFLRATSPEEEILSLLPKENIRFAVDAGAYNGDTAKEMRNAFPNLRTVLAIEPDDRTFRRLSALAEGEMAGMLRPLHAAVWSTEGEAEFHGSGNRNSSLEGASFEHKEQSVPLVTVDASVGNETVDYIKFDVEGAEREALLGSEKTLRKCRPALRIAAYHRSEDLFSLPLLAHELLPGSRIFLRRRAGIPAWDLDVLILPEGRF